MAGTIHHHYFLLLRIEINQDSWPTLHGVLMFFKELFQPLFILP